MCVCVCIHTITRTACHELTTGVLTLPEQQVLLFFFFLGRQTDRQTDTHTHVRLSNALTYIDSEMD